MKTETTKASLLDTMRDERASWEALLAQVGEARMLEPGVEGVWSVKEIVVHITAYERWFGAQLRASMRGEQPTALELYGRETSEDLENMEQDEFNAWIVEQNRDRPVSMVLAEERHTFQQLLETVHQLTEEELTDPRRFDWLEEHAAIEYLPSQTYQHYRLHMPAIQTWLERQEA